MIKLSPIFIYFLSSLVMWSTELMAKEKLIIDTEIRFDVKQDLALVQSLTNYLNEFRNQSANESNRTMAINFINSSYFSSRANCAYTKAPGGKKLVCLVSVKKTIRDIAINRLPASLLESELKRRLPVQVGYGVDVDESFHQTLSLIRGRVETFLRKNGYYGATVSVNYQLIEKTAEVDILVAINGGLFAHVADVKVSGDSLIDHRVIKKLYQRMCFAFDRIVESAVSLTLRCYSRELERETTQNLQERFAKMGYVQARIRVTHDWLDPHDAKTPFNCLSHDEKDTTSRCVNLRIDIDKGPKVVWSINVKDRPLISRNVFVQFLESAFSIELLSRLGTSPDSDETGVDQVIVKQDLLSQITFTAAKNVDEQELSESASEIRNFLIARGYPNAEVVPHLLQEDPQNLVVNFDVYAGSPRFVSSVVIRPESYRKFITDEDLTSFISPRSFSSNGRLSYEDIENAKKEIEDRLNARGFYDVSIRVDMQDKDGVHVAFYVQSSPREINDEVHILNGFGELNEQIAPSLANCDAYSASADKESARKLCHNSSFVRDMLAQDGTRIAEHYQSQGYLYAKVESEVVPSKDGQQVIFRVFDSRYGPSEPLKKQAIKDIIISGNATTRASVIKRLFPRDHDTLDPIALKKGIANLREAGVFSRIDHKVLFTSDKSDEAYFMVQLTERPSLSIDTSLAFSTDQLLSIETELEENNLFSSMLKLNTSLGFGLFFGRQTFFNNKLTWPFMFGKPLRLTIQAPMVVYDDFTHHQKPSRRLQTKASIGLDWRLTTRITPYVRYWLVLTKEDNNPSILRGAKEHLLTLDGLIPTMKIESSIRGVLKPGISYNILDNPFDPHKGVDLNLWTELSGGLFQGDPFFLNLGTQNRFYIPLGASTLVLQTTFMRAFIPPSEKNWKALKNTSSAMDALGGDRSVRGYQDQTIGTTTTLATPSDVYGGYFSTITNIEFRFPLGAKSASGNFSGGLFVDQGMLIACSSLFKCADGKSLHQIVEDGDFGLSIGAALRYSLPVGPLSVDFGFSPLTGNYRTHFLFGYAF